MLLDGFSTDPSKPLRKLPACPGKPRHVAFNYTHAHISHSALWIINHDTISLNKVEPVCLYLPFTVTTRYRTKQQLYFQYYLSYSVGIPETSWNNRPCRIWFPNHTWYNHRTTSRSREILAQEPSSLEVGIRIIACTFFKKDLKTFSHGWSHFILQDGLGP